MPSHDAKKSGGWRHVDKSNEARKAARSHGKVILHCGNKTQSISFVSLAKNGKQYKKLCEWVGLNRKTGKLQTDDGTPPASSSDKVLGPPKRPSTKDIPAGGAVATSAGEAVNVTPPTATTPQTAPPVSFTTDKVSASLVGTGPSSAGIDHSGTGSSSAASVPVAVPSTPVTPSVATSVPSVGAPVPASASAVAAVASTTSDAVTEGSSGFLSRHPKMFGNAVVPLTPPRCPALRAVSSTGAAEAPPASSSLRLPHSSPDETEEAAIPPASLAKAQQDLETTQSQLTAAMESQRGTEVRLREACDNIAALEGQVHALRLEALRRRQAQGAGIVGVEASLKGVDLLDAAATKVADGGVLESVQALLEFVKQQEIALNESQQSLTHLVEIQKKALQKAGELSTDALEEVSGLPAILKLFAKNKGVSLATNYALNELKCSNMSEEELQAAAEAMQRTSRNQDPLTAQTPLQYQQPTLQYQQPPPQSQFPQSQFPQQQQQQQQQQHFEQQQQQHFEHQQHHFEQQGTPAAGVVADNVGLTPFDFQGAGPMSEHETFSQTLSELHIDPAVLSQADNEQLAEHLTACLGDADQAVAPQVRTDQVHTEQLATYFRGTEI